MTLESLFPKTRRELLALLFLHPGASFHLRDLARRLRTGHGAVQREVAHMVKDQIITARREGRGLYYQANPRSFVFPELQGLVEKTVGPVGRLREALIPLVPRIRAAFVYGSIAARSARESSDIDLMVIGDVTFGDVTEVVSGAERALGRDINPTIYPVEEYRAKLARGSPFLTTVLGSPKDFVIGDKSVLESLV